MNSILFIPDISGFTKFVNETEVEHSRHIISELLELIIDADKLGLTVAEIEGDAVLFYQKDQVPSVAQLVEQAREMFVRFHAHLKQYETRRICKCGACATAQDLSLKIVTHQGPIEFLNVKNFEKPYGPGVILAHRLLKNNLDGSEYLLLSNSFTDELEAATADAGESESGDALPDWAQVQADAMTYPEIGSVDYNFIRLNALHDQVPDPDSIASFERIANPVATEGFIDRPVDELFEVISNLNLRLDWNNELDDLKYEPDRVNRVGTKHQCVVSGKFIDFETITDDFGEETMVYGERLESPPVVDELAIFYLMQKEGDGSHLRIEGHFHANRLLAKLMTPVFRLGMGRNVKSAFGKIKTVAEAAKLRGELSTTTGAGPVPSEVDG